MNLLFNFIIYTVIVIDQIICWWLLIWRLVENSQDELIQMLVVNFINFIDKENLNNTV